MALAVTFSRLCVPRHRGHGHELELGAGDGQQEGHRVVVARVAVDDHRRRHGASCWRAACSNAAMHDRRPPSQRRHRPGRPGRHHRRRGVGHHRLGHRHRHRQPRWGGDDLPVRVRHLDRPTGVTSSGRATPARARTPSASARRSPDLTSNTTYHYRVVATNARGARAARIARCGPAPRRRRRRSRAARPAASSAFGATLNARVNPRALATTVRFEYGTSTSYGSATPEQAIGAGTRPSRSAPRSAACEPNTRYNYRAVATSAAGVTRSSNRTFTTSRVPTGVAITPSTIRPDVGHGADDPGTVSGAGSTPVALEKQDFPYTGPFAQIATATANSRGAFSLTAPPLFITARLRVVTRTAVVAHQPGGDGLGGGQGRAEGAAAAWRVVCGSRAPPGRPCRRAASHSSARPAAAAGSSSSARAITPLTDNRSRYRFSAVARRSRAHRTTASSCSPATAARTSPARAARSPSSAQR